MQTPPPSKNEIKIHFKINQRKKQKPNDIKKNCKKVNQDGIFSVKQ
jgi:hypothetical protein